MSDIAGDGMGNDGFVCEGARRDCDIAVGVNSHPPLPSRSRVGRVALFAAVVQTSLEQCS